MDFFSLLREHARTRTETLAVSSVRRCMTYRKLWSRIERATARLQREWGVRSGDVVAYAGISHPDALVLFFALARCGARLLPIPASLNSSECHFFAQEFRLQLLVKDDDSSLSVDMASLSVKPLSSLIATRCPQEPEKLVEDPQRPVLFWCAEEPQGTSIRTYSLAQLWDAGVSVSHAAEAKVERLFFPSVLSNIVLPGLQRGGCLILP